VKLLRSVIGILLLLAISMGSARLAVPHNHDTLPFPPAEKRNPLVEGYLYVSGLVDGAWGNYEAARGYFARIREINPSSLLGYTPVSRTYVAQGHLNQALYWMSEALKVDPQDFESGAWMLILYDCLEDYEAAEYWSEWLKYRITNQPMPMAVQASHYYLAGNFELALQFSNLALKLNLPARRDSNAIFMRIKRDEALGSGDPEPGIRLFEERFPELFLPQPQITADNIAQATDLALLLKIAGRSTQSRRLLEKVLLAYDLPFLTSAPYGVGLVPVKAEALAVLGENQQALSELRRIIDAGWRIHWRWKTDLNPNFNGIRQSGEFQKMIAELEADMARQRTRSREVTLRGELSLPP